MFLSSYFMPTKKTVANKVNRRKTREGALGHKTVKNSVAKKVVAKKTPAKQTKKYAAAKRKPVSKKPVATKKPAAKKVAAKKAIKKSPTKKTVGKAVAMKKPVKDMVYASDQESFWMQNGEILNSLMALNEAFAAMDKDIYQFHAHGDRNDFSIWVDSVLCDEECAADLKKAKSSKSARTIVVKHLKLYSI
jgi:hypothetical protein